MLINSSEKCIKFAYSPQTIIKIFHKFLDNSVPSMNQGFILHFQNLKYMQMNKMYHADTQTMTEPT